MENKTITYIGLGVIALLFIGTFAMGSMTGMATRDNSDDIQPVVISNVQEDMAGHHDDNKAISSNNIDLSKYRLENIPVDCRLADYDNDVKKWTEHLSHHGNTKYCLEYYQDIIAPTTLENSSEGSSDMPEKCKQPVGRDLESWKEHLEHHQKTEECLKYFN